MAVGNTFVPPEAKEPAWAWLKSGIAQLMLAKASEPVVPSQQAVLFYLYVEDVAAKRDELREAEWTPATSNIHSSLREASSELPILTGTF